MRIDEKIKQLQSIDVKAIVNGVFVEASDTIIKLNQDQLYERGVIDVTDPTKREQYNKATIRQKKKTAKFPKADFVTLRWDNNFYDEMRVIIFDEHIEIHSYNPKWPNWLEPNPRFTNALGLTEDSKELLKEELRDKFLTAIRNEL